METGDRVSVNILLAEIGPLVGDDTFKAHGLSKSFYTSQIQQAVEDLAIDTYFDIRTIDLPFPQKRLGMPMPDGAFNIREIYLFNCGCSRSSALCQCAPTDNCGCQTCSETNNNGEPCTCCTPNSYAIVHWKRLFNNRGKGAAYTAHRSDRNGGNLDPIYPSDSFPILTEAGVPSNLYYANAQNGLVMFSSNSCSFNYVRFVYNGMGNSIGDGIDLPRIFRTAIVDYVVEKTFRILAAKDPRMYRVMYLDAFQRLNDARNGTWVKAERRAKTLATWQKDEVREWSGRGNW